MSTRLPARTALNGSRLHGLFLHHREAPSGPSPERDAALLGLQCVPDVAPRTWQPPEHDLFCGLSKVEGRLRAGGMIGGDRGGGQGLDGLGSLCPRVTACSRYWERAFDKALEVGMMLNGEQRPGERPAGGGGGL